MGKRPGSRRRKRGHRGGGAGRPRDGQGQDAQRVGEAPAGVRVTDNRTVTVVGAGPAVRDLPAPGTRPEWTAVSHARRSPVVVRVAWQCRVHAARRRRRVRTAARRDLDFRGRSRSSATRGSDSAHRATATGDRRTRQTRIAHLAEAPARGRATVCSGRAPCDRDRRASRELSRRCGDHSLGAHDAPMVRTGAMVDPALADATISASAAPATSVPPQGIPRGDR